MKARYNFTVSHIKTVWIRRTLMIVTFIPLIILNIVFIIIGSSGFVFKHLFEVLVFCVNKTVENTKTLYNSFYEHW